MGLPGVGRVPGVHRIAGLGNLGALAVFIRSRLAEVGDTIAPLWPRREDGRPAHEDLTHAASGRSAAVAVIGAAAPFAPTSYARARLLRQLHATGLLDDRETRQAEHLLGLAR